jgi:hypothetical protein
LHVRVFLSFHYIFFIIIYFIYEVIGNLININIIKKMLDTYVQRASICAYTSFEYFVWCLPVIKHRFLHAIAPPWCNDICDQRVSDLASMTFFFSWFLCWHFKFQSSVSLCLFIDIWSLFFYFLFILYEVIYKIIFFLIFLIC